MVLAEFTIEIPLLSLVFHVIFKWTTVFSFKHTCKTTQQAPFPFPTTTTTHNTMSGSSAPPGGHKTLQKRRQAQAAKEKKASQTPASATQAGLAGSTNNILKIFTDEADGWKVDPSAVLFLAVAFIFSVIALHVISKVTGKLF